LTVAASWPGIFTEHPIRPIEARDPLASFDPACLQSGCEADGPARLRIGYGCFWESVPQRTWSGSAWNLREELRKTADTIDIGVEFPSLTRIALKAIHTRYRGGRFTTSWTTSRLTDRYVTAVLRRGIGKHFGGARCDAVLLIDSIAAVPEPFFIYYDSSWDAMIASADSSERYAVARRITPRNLARRRDHELAIYERAAGVIAMSHWLAQCLVEQSGLPPEKVHVAHPGFSSTRTLRRNLVGSESDTTEQRLPVRKREAPRRKLLFIGRQYEAHDFYRKGGDLVVGALGILRREYDPRITLTVVGMDKWPLPGSPPEGVDFRGVLAPDEVAKLYHSHDLFVMPSRLEPFGVVFVEALSQGMPCVGRNVCAMPELITPGVSGALIEKDDEHELAATIASVLADDELYKKCYARAPHMAAYFSWKRTALDINQVIAQTIGI
jgi:glycosyltransferase involved in cell wall biosynthesis